MLETSSTCLSWQVISIIGLFGYHIYFQIVESPEPKRKIYVLIFYLHSYLRKGFLLYSGQILPSFNQAGAALEVVFKYKLVRNLWIINILSLDVPLAFFLLGRDRENLNKITWQGIMLIKSHLLLNQLLLWILSWKYYVSISHLYLENKFYFYKIFIICTIT